MTTPFLCVLIAFFLIYVPRIFVAVAQSRLPGGMDNKHPRDQQTKLTGWARRANAAHANAFESFAPFAAAVFVSHLGRGNPSTAATLAVVFVVARLAYFCLYVANIDLLRTLVWALGLVCTVWLFVSPWLA